MTAAVLARPTERPVAGQRPYQAYGAAEQLLYDHSPEIILSGPAGTGKSRACLEKLHLLALKYPGMRGLMTRKTRRSLTTTGLVTFEEKVLPEGSGIKLFDGSQYRYPNGSRLIVGGLDDTAKIMSSEYDAIFVQEAREIAEDVWEDLTSRLRNGVVPYQQIIGDTNPDAPSHWIRRRSMRGQLALRESRHEHNPMVWDQVRNEPTDQGRAYLSVLDNLTGVRYKRLRQGLWVASDNMVYEGWDPAVHLIDRFPIPAAWPRFRAIDFGFTNPFCCAWYAMDGDGRLYRYREVYGSQTRVRDWGHLIYQLTGREKIRATVTDHDHEYRASLETHMAHSADDCDRREVDDEPEPPRRYSLTIPANKDVQAGIEAVANRLKKAGDGQPRLMLLRDSLVQADESLIDRKLPTCTEEEIEGYVWDKATSIKYGEVMLEQPLKKDDHGCFVAGTMVDTAYGPMPIETISWRTLVWTRPGLRHVLAAGMTDPEAEVYTLSLSNGVCLTGTGNHPIWVEGRGWVRMDALRYNDVVLCDRKPSSSTASGSAATPTLRRGLSAPTTCPVSRIARPALAASMRRFGSRFTGRFHRVITSITKTLTRSTMTLPTWSALKSTSTSSSTSNVVGSGATRPTSWPTSRASTPSPLPGIALPRAEHGTANRPRRPTRSERRLSGPVSSAGDRSPRSLAGTTTASAPTPARLDSGTPLVSMTSSAPAPSAQLRSRSTATARSSAAPVRVVSVCAEAERRTVYNLTVEGCPEYFANGVLVHNCDQLRYMVMHFDAEDAGWSKLIGAQASISSTPKPKPSPFGPVADVTARLREVRKGKPTGVRRVR